MNWTRYSWLTPPAEAPERLQEPSNRRGGVVAPLSVLGALARALIGGRAAERLPVATPAPAPAPPERTTPYTHVCVRLLRPLPLDRPEPRILEVGRVVAVAPEVATQLVQEGRAVCAPWPEPRERYVPFAEVRFVTTPPPPEEA